MAKVVQNVILLAILATISNGEDMYAGCLKNYSVLEKAVLEDDRYEIIKAFYPPENSLPSVFVKITYVSAEDANISERWLWTSVPIYLIQPPSVFQFMALLFSHHQISNRIRDLIVHLPPDCYNTSAPSCHKNDANVTFLNNRYLDVLTNEIHLFARYDGRNERVILDDIMPSTSLRLDNNCASIDKKSFYLYNTFCFIVLPVLIYLLLSFLLHSLYPKLRTVLSPSLPKHSVNPNLAGLTLTGLVLSLYVLICDSFALFYSMGKHELSILYDYEDQHVQNYTTAVIIIVATFDLIAFIISLVNLFLLCCLQSERCKEKHLLNCFIIACSICACKFIKLNVKIYEPIRTPQNDDANNPQSNADDSQSNAANNPQDGAANKPQEDATLEMQKQRANHLRRQERWILQEREKKRQSREANVESLSWMEQWENDLEQREDQLNHWNNILKLQQHELPDERCADEWKTALDEWETQLTKLYKDTPEFEATLQKNEDKQMELDRRQTELNEERKQLNKLQEKLNRQMFAENKAWLLLISLIAPFICIGTHGGFVVMAWASDPGEASSLAVVFTLSFFYYFFGFRQLYIRISSIPCFKLKTARTTKFDELRDVSMELENYHNKLREINFSALLCELLFIPFFMGIQALIIFSYYYLPGPISSVPLNVMNLLQLVLFFGTGLITYKLFTFSAPTEEIILDRFMKAYRPHDQSRSSGDTAGGVGEALADALNKYVGRGRSNTLSDNWIKMGPLA